MWNYYLPILIESTLAEEVLLLKPREEVLLLNSRKQRQQKQLFLVFLKSRKQKPPPSLLHCFESFHGHVLLWHWLAAAFFSVVQEGSPSQQAVVQ